MSTSADSLTKTLLTVSTPPFIHDGTSVPAWMRDIFIALIPALLLSLWDYGLASARVMAVAAGTAVLTEALCAKLSGQKQRIDDGSALLTGLLFACLLPAKAPWWIVMAGAALSIALGRQIFGGLGTNPLCPPLVGWACLLLSWPEYLDASSMILNTDLIDPLLRLKYFGVNSLLELDSLDLLRGKQLGGLGNVYIGALLLGGLFLIAKRRIPWEIPTAFLLGALAVGWIFYRSDPNTYLAPDLYLLTGSTMFAAFFLSVDPASSPVGRTAMLLYGALGGALLVLIRSFGAYPDGALFAVLLANLTTPLLDMIRPAPWGKRN